ncbi:MAG: AraC family transcriptional regulator [Puniceicoccaceae bacterium]|nr:MAG: AraC family transcriptional regulator [Puniceicoccaceae bacterium]
MVNSSPPQFLHIGRLPPSSDWHMHPHHHRFHEVVVPLRGVLHLRSGHKTHSVGAGRLVLYPANVIHEEWTDAEQPVESIFMGFDSAALEADAVLMSADPDGRIRQILRWIHHDESTLRQGREIFRSRSLDIILDWFANLATPPPDRWVQHIRTFMRKNLDQPVDLQQLAKLAGCSRFHFVRRYKQLTGITPMADLKRIRTDYAREQILSSNLSLKEVAQVAGFADEYTLSRSFRRQYGTPPGGLRRMVGPMP